jgi:hypothetical protein
MPVTSGGIQVQGVTCTFSSGAVAVASVVPATGVVTAVSVGNADITATCGTVTGTLTLTVRPRLVTLTLSTGGPGSGSLFANPPAGGTTASYDEGTTVTLTANPATGSAIEGWTGACANAGTSSTCTITMIGNQSTGVLFKTAETFVTSGTFGGTLGDVSDGNCTWRISATVTNLTIVIEGRSTGVVAPGTEASNIGITVIGAAPGASCTASPFSENGAGNLQVSGQTVSGSLSNASGRHTISISATRSGTTISGTATITQVTRDGYGTDYTTSNSFSVTLNKQ